MFATYFIVLLLGTFAQGIQYYVLDDQVREITCNYNEACASEDAIIEIESGYKIKITVKSVDIDGSNGDFLLIKSGKAIEDGLTGRIFTHTLSEEKEYISLTENVLIHFAASEENTNTHTAFVLTAERFGEQSTTLPSDVTDVPWPIPSEDDFAYLTVNFSMSKVDNEMVFGFKEIVTEMGREYVSKNFELAESISIENVQIQSITECPIFWPNRDGCVQITFAFPILLSEESELYGTYQLNGSHLDSMWDAASNYFRNTDYDLYELPNNNRVIIIWMSVICATILLFGTFYLVSGYECSAFVLRKKKHEQEQRDQTSSGNNQRSSIASLPPHPLQPMPHLFDSDVSTFYNPDSPTVILRSPGRTDNHEETRDTLELENLRQFSFNAQSLDNVTNA